VLPLLHGCFCLLVFEEICETAMNFFVHITLIKIANAPLDKSAMLVIYFYPQLTEHTAAALHWQLPNSVNAARNLAGAGLGQISEKWPDLGFAEADIWYKPICM